MARPKHQAPPPPPYTPSYPSLPSTGTRNLSNLPLPVLFQIISYTLDPRSTPNRWVSDIAEERVRRIWGLFIGLRGVCRSFWLVSTSILRTRYHPIYLSMIQSGYSSDAYPHDSHSSYFDSQPIQITDTKTSPAPSGSRIQGESSVFSRRSRETAIFDRWIAIRLGGELRKVESELSEDSGDEKDIFGRFQPAARIEDLLLIYIPKSLIVPLHLSSGSPTTTLPLPHSHLSITLTPGWCQLYIWAKPYGTRGNGKDMVLEVRRSEILEDVVRRIGEGLEDMGKGLVEWGSRIL